MQDTPQDQPDRTPDGEERHRTTHSDAQYDTQNATQDATRNTPENPGGGPPSHPSSSDGTNSRATTRTNTPRARFTPGQLVADRYRIVAFLGRGGMGEVYRADDLELAQSVAIKFLPARIAADPALAERVRAEVRLARGITHRNVCRIHDIARLRPTEGNGQGGDLFITMEYVDGEDLATLLRRIGKLPQDKAIDVARQLCAALAAAHDQGVIHRDLKPANVMLDGRGNARLTDFGIAAIDDESDERDASSGTPAYMSPEQFNGVGVSKRSDIYSLGLVIYELLTGRPAWRAESLAQLRTLRESSGSPVSLTSASRSDIDPALAALVERCTETDPDARPASALAVAAALPGADPLAAAIAAGETPSPELIAASGGRGVLSPAIAATYALIAIALATAAIALRSPNTLIHHTGPPPATAVIHEAAGDMIRSLGHQIDPDVPSLGAWHISGSTLNRVASAVKSGEADWFALREGINTPIWYWLRFEPGGFEPRTPDNKVWTDFPVRDAPGSMIIKLDQNRRLRGFTHQPPPFDTQPDDTEPEWGLAFELAGLDFDQFTPIEARANPGNDPTIRRAWTGPAPEDRTDADPIQLDVYLGASGGKITDVTITQRTDNTPPITTPPENRAPDSDPASSNPTPTNTPGPAETTPASDTQPTPANAEPEPTQTAPPANTAALIQSIVQWFLIGTLTVGAGLIAYRNIRLRRGDARRATRLAVTLFLLGALSSLLDADIAPFSLPKLIGPYPTWSASIGFALMAAACYIAAEPLARSRWPGSLVSWTRLFSGQFKDPMIGRDTLTSICLGAAIFLLTSLGPSINTALGDPPEGPGQEMFFLLPTLKGIRFVLALVLSQIGQSFLNAAAIALLVLLATLLLGLIRIKQRWPALILVTALIIMQQLAMPNLSITDRAIAAIANLAVLIILARIGLFAAAITLCTMNLLTIAAATTPLGHWWTPATLTPLVILAAVLAFAYRTATAGRSIFGEAHP